MENSIPKQIFFFWGNEAMSWMRYMTLYSFRKYNPDWRMILYVSSSKKCTLSTLQDYNNYTGDNYYEKIKNLNVEFIEWDIADNNIIETDNKDTMTASHKSNFLKWCKLAEEGGIYADMDIIFYKPIDEFYNKMVTAGYDTAICETDYLSIGFMASQPQNAFFRDIFINTLKTYEMYGNNLYQSAGVVSVYNLYGIRFGKILHMAEKKYPQHKFYNIPFEIVYPYGCEKIEYAFNTDIDVKNLLDSTIGYHWYGGHPEAQKYNNMLNETNYKEYNNLFANVAKYVLDS